jgi:hypothetical protein
MALAVIADLVDKRGGPDSFEVARLRAGGTIILRLFRSRGPLGGIVLKTWICEGQRDTHTLYVADAILDHQEAAHWASLGEWEMVGSIDRLRAVRRRLNEWDPPRCTCTVCATCGGKTICGLCNQCTRCAAHTPGCPGCPGDWAPQQGGLEP